MTKKDYKQILSLRKKGVDDKTCILLILQQTCGYENSSVAFRTAAEKIDEFYHEVVISETVEEKVTNYARTANKSTPADTIEKLQEDIDKEIS